MEDHGLWPRGSGRGGSDAECTAFFSGRASLYADEEQSRRLCNDTRAAMVGGLFSFAAMAALTLVAVAAVALERRASRPSRGGGSGGCGGACARRSGGDLGWRSALRFMRLPVPNGDDDDDAQVGRRRKTADVEMSPMHASELRGT